MAIEERQADNRAKMTSLASQFPVLKNAPGVNPWDSERLDEWASGGVSHSATRRPLSSTCGTLTTTGKRGGST
jgi:hypothetical protein